MRAYTTKQRTQMNIAMLVASVILGVISWFLATVIYDAVVYIWARPWVIGVVFGSLALILLLGVYIISNIQGVFEKNIMTGGSAGSVVLLILAASIAINPMIKTN